LIGQRRPVPKPQLERRFGGRILVHLARIAYGYPMQKQAHTTLAQKLALVTCSIAMVFFVVCAGELYCRWFTSINFLGISRGLFVSHAFGDSYGNRPDYKGEVFGAAVQIDSSGFRVDPAFPSPSGTDAVLILGDSVAFGVGVLASKSVAGLLQKTNATNLRFYNSSAIGYGLHDYRNVVGSLVPHRSEVKYVMLFYCLNDIYDTNAQEIEAAVSETNSTAIEPSPLSSLQAFASSTNRFLRTRSKLYLYVKTALTDPAARYFKQDLAEYRRRGSDIDVALGPLREIAEKLAASGLAFEVFLMPYEAQLRKNAAGDSLLPQTLITNFLRRNKISYVDAFSAFRQSALPPEALYLYGDPMHLSAEGHLLAFEIAEAELKKMMNGTSQHY
jgi:hypothetical protein